LFLSSRNRDHERDEDLSGGDENFCCSLTRKRMEEKMRNKQRLLDDIENLIYCKVNLGYNQIILGV
jgi:hypothetical protein